MSRLPNPGGDDNVWGTVLNDFLLQIHNSNGTIKDGIVNTSTIVDGAVAAAKLDSAVQSKLDTVDTLTSLSTTTVAGTSYTFVLSDASKVIETTNASAVTITIPPNSSVAFPVGTVIELFQYNTGAITLAPGAGVTIRSADGLLSARTQYSTLSLRKRATNEWVLVGDLA